MHDSFENLRVAPKRAMISNVLELELTYIIRFIVDSLKDKKDLKQSSKNNLKNIEKINQLKIKVHKVLQEIESVNYDFNESISTSLKKQMLGLNIHDDLDKHELIGAFEKYISSMSSKMGLFDPQNIIKNHHGTFGKPNLFVTSFLIYFLSRDKTNDSWLTEFVDDSKSAHVKVNFLIEAIIEKKLASLNLSDKEKKAIRNKLSSLSFLPKYNEDGTFHKYKSNLKRTICEGKLIKMDSSEECLDTVASFINTKPFTFIERLCDFLLRNRYEKIRLKDSTLKFHLTTQIVDINDEEKAVLYNRGQYDQGSSSIFIYEISENGEFNCIEGFKLLN